MIIRSSLFLTVTQPITSTLAEPDCGLPNERKQ